MTNIETDLIKNYKPFNRFKKHLWYTNLIVNKTIDPDDEVSLWILPAGCECVIDDELGMDVICNGHNKIVNSEFGKMLLNAGLRGGFIFHTTEVIAQTNASWMTWWLAQEPTKDDPKLKSITVTTFGQEPIGDLPFQVRSIKPIKIKASEVYDNIKARSPDLNISVFLVETKNGDVYKMEPERRTTAVVLAATKSGLVVHTESNKIALISKISKRFMMDMIANRIETEDLIGEDVILQYTMYTEGKRIANYKSVKLFSLLDQKFDDSNKVADSEIIYPFPQIKTKLRSSLTVTRCSRTSMFLNGSKDICTAVDPDSKATLFTLSKGAEYGDLVVLLTNSLGVDEVWKMNSDYSLDALEPDTFIDCIVNEVKYVTNLDASAFGIYYKYMDDEYIGDCIIDSKERDGV